MTQLGKAFCVHAVDVGCCVPPGKPFDTNSFHFRWCVCDVRAPYNRLNRIRFVGIKHIEAYDRLCVCCLRQRHSLCESSIYCRRRRFSYFGNLPFAGVETTPHIYSTLCSCITSITTFNLMSNRQMLIFVGRFALTLPIHFTIGHTPFARRRNWIGMCRKCQRQL